MAKQKFRKDVCYICGDKVFRDLDDKSLFCGKFDCLRKFTDEFECPKCGTHWKDFSKGGMGMGMVTVWTLSCPKHSEVRFTRYTYCPDVEKCPVCNDEIVGEIGIEFLREFGLCLRCEKIQGDVESERRAESIEEEE
jgi:hypothetical protein